MINKKLNYSILFIFLFLNLNIVYSTNLVQNFLYFDYNKSSSLNYIAFEIQKDIKIDQIQFNLETYYNENKTNISCQKNISFEQDDFSKKIVCGISNLGEGKYTFISTISNNSTIINKLKNIKYANSNFNLDLKFKTFENKTQILIQIQNKSQLNSNNEYKVQTYIPKEVIYNLNDSNKDKLITSKNRYIIINNDPLIAWNLNEVPTNITYTINKKISKEDMDKFNLNITSENSKFKYMNYIIISLILLIILLILKPLINQKNEN